MIFVDKSGLVIPNTDIDREATYHILDYKYIRLTEHGEACLVMTIDKYSG